MTARPVATVPIFAVRPRRGSLKSSTGRQGSTQSGSAPGSLAQLLAACSCMSGGCLIRPAFPSGPTSKDGPCCLSLIFLSLCIAPSLFSLSASVFIRGLASLSYINRLTPTERSFRVARCVHSKTYTVLNFYCPIDNFVVVLYPFWPCLLSLRAIRRRFRRPRTSLISGCFRRLLVPRIPERCGRKTVGYEHSATRAAPELRLVKKSLAVVAPGVCN